MERKIAELSNIKVIDEAAGIVEAFTNSMGIVDSDLDIIETTAFDNSIKNNLPLPALVGHDPSAVVGKVIAAQAVEGEDGTARLYNRIQFNLDTQAGRDSFSNIAGGFVRSWSVGFNIPDGAVELDRDQDGSAVRRIKDLDWVEVSSVLRGASPDTATISAKSETPEDADEQKIVIPPHDTGVVQEPWSGADAVRALNSDDQAAYEEAFAYRTYGENPEAKGSYRFIHHEVDDGDVGDANVVACQTGIGVLNGARGGTTIPESDKQGVWRHLAKHLEDGGFEPPELKTASPDATAADVAANAVRADQAPAETDATESLAARLLTARLRRAKNVFIQRLES